MPQQFGVARRMPSTPPPRLSGRQDPAALRADLEAMAQWADALRREIEQLYDTLSRQTNELLMSGNLADRPSAGVRGRVFWATDQASGSRLAIDTGSTWQGT